MGCATAAVFLPLPTSMTTLLTGVLTVIITSALAVLFFIDVRLLLLPDGFIAVATAATVLLLAAQGRSPTTALWGIVFGTGFLLLLWLLTAGRGIGLGDVKLMVVLGALLGPLSTATALLLAFAAGALVGLCLLATGRATPKTPIPFGPYLIAATGLVTLMPQLPEYVLGWVVG